MRLPQLREAEAREFDCVHFMPHRIEVGLWEAAGLLSGGERTQSEVPLGARALRLGVPRAKAARI